MPPDDPLGRNGPKLDRFLRKSRFDPTSAPTCPYGKKCTYGNKCKYYHPERGNVPQKTITERLAEQAQKQLLEVKSRGRKSMLPTCKTLSLPLSNKDLAKGAVANKTPLARTQSIVPSLALPTELTEQRPTKERAGVEDRLPIAKSRSVENMAQVSVDRAYMAGAMLAAPLPSAGSFSTPPPFWCVSRKLSDPPCDSGAVGGGGGTEFDDETSRPNQHRKVQRQLTLNPSCDARLYSLTGLAPPYPPPPIPVHSIVTRNASAPASQQPPQSNRSLTSGHMQRLNSTSDTQLNLYGGAGGSQHSIGDPFDPEWTQSPPPPLPVHSWAVRTSSLPAHRPLSAENKAYPFSAKIDPNTEARYKLFFHLAAIFPEEQVRRVMAVMPEETNAQNICAAILALYPPAEH